jgi:hypothetical protein
MRPLVLAFVLSSFAVTTTVAQAPTPAPAESPTIKVLTGLTVPEFEQEMQMMVQALGVPCGYCHVARNFASEDNEKKIIARRMIEMTKQINAQFFPDFTPPDGESKLGRVTCMTCHQGEQKPRSGP